MVEPNLLPHLVEEFDPTSGDRQFTSQREEWKKEDVCVGAGRDLNIHGNVKLKFNYNQFSEPQSSGPDEKIEFQVKDPIETFTGRKEVLENLHQSIQECRNKDLKISILSQTSSITGLGGIGKSETVRMYIKQFGQEYDHIVWIDAENPSEATAQFKYLASQELKLKLKDEENKSIKFPLIIAKVYKKLCRKPKRLLIIFDNAEALDDSLQLKNGIRQFLPAQTTTIEPPIVLVTSRQQNWKDVNVIKLGLWEIEECIEHIFKRLKLQDTEENRKDANELAELFDRLPIAIQVAVSVILVQSEEKRSVSTQDYGIQDLISEYNKGQPEAELLENDRPISIETTIQNLLQVSLQRLIQYKQGQLAIRILAYMAYLSPTKIPKDMIYLLITMNYKSDENAFDTALALLTRYSIIEGHQTYFTIHRVFQKVVIMNLQTSNSNGPMSSIFSDEMALLQELTIKLKVLAEIQKEHATVIDLNDLTTNLIHTTEYIIQHPLVKKFFSFIEAVASSVSSQQYEVAIKFYTNLFLHEPHQKCKFTILTNIATIYNQNSKFKKAIKIYEILLHGGEFNNQEILGQEEVLGGLHDDTLDTKDSIAKCLLRLEKINEALTYFNSVLKVKLELLGDLHPSTIATKHNIAYCFKARGENEKALEQFYLILQDHEEVLGDQHVSTLTTKQNIAQILVAQGKFEEALNIYYSVLNTTEQVFGALHPDTLMIKHGIAQCLNSQGKREEALELYYDLLETEEEVLGANHLNTLTTKSNIATSQAALGNHEEALELYYVVLEAQEKALGPLHPDTLKTKNNIAQCLGKLEEYEQALELFYSVLNEKRDEFGDSHPCVFDTLGNVAECFNEMGKKEEALNLYLVVVKAQEEALGPLHPSTLSTKESIAQSQFVQGEHDEALKLYNDVLQGKEKVLGCLHPDVLYTKHTISQFLIILGRIEEALKLLNDIPQARGKVLGDLHPTTLSAKHDIAQCLNLQGENEEALELFYLVLEDQKKVLGHLHPSTLTTMGSTAKCLTDLGKYEEALKIYYTVLEAQAQEEGNVDTLNTKLNLALCLKCYGKYKEALDIYHSHRVMERVEETYGDFSPMTVTTKYDVAEALEGAGRKQEALNLYYVVLEAQERFIDALHPIILKTKESIARCLSLLGKEEEALKLYYVVLEQKETLLGVSHTETVKTRECIASCIRQQKRRKRIYQIAFVGILFTCLVLTFKRRLG